MVTRTLPASLAAWMLIGAISVLAQTPAAPRLLFTDLQSGPVTGGEENLGAFITIYGEGFGPSRNDSRVTIGGTEVARYVSWGENDAPARTLDRIVVQPGPQVATGGIVVTVQGRTSNSLPFTVRSGSIFFVDPAASGSSDQNPGSATQPFRTLYRPREVLEAGDIVYLRGGTFAQMDPAAAGWDAVLFLSRDVAASGTAEKPIAYIGYPGNPPVLGQETARRIFMLNQDPGPLSYYTLANLSLTAGQEPLPLSGTGHRIVGNRIFDGAFSDSGAIGVNGSCSNIQILGNVLSRNGREGEKLHHGFYIGGYGTNRDIEFGWNEIAVQRGGRGIQLYGHVAGDMMDGIRIHDNLIHGSELNNIVVGGSDGGTDVIGTVYLYNNIIAGSRNEPGLRINTPAGTVFIQNNTFYGNAEAQLSVQSAGARKITLQNNLIYASTGQGYLVFGEGGADSGVFASSDHNLWFNAGPAPAWDAVGVSGDPRLRDPAGRDFRPAEGSAAIDAGADTGVYLDFTGIARPQGSSFDIGAHEWFQGSTAGLSLYFPRLISADGIGPGGYDEYTGFAIVNLSGQDALLTFTAYDRSGALLLGPQISNPRDVILKAGQQLPQVDYQLFGAGLPQQGTVGWVRVDSSVQQVAGFFLLFDSNLSVLDGADVSSSRVARIVLTDSNLLGTTEIHIANPNPQPAALTFELITFDGTLRAPAVDRTIEPNGVLAIERMELFPGVLPERSDSIWVTASQGVVPFEVLRRGRRFVRALRGQDATAGSATLYCPQYVVGGQLWRTTVKIMNLGSTDALITYRWIGDDGVQIGNDQIGSIRSRGYLGIVSVEAFGNAPDRETRGYLEIVSNGPRLAGSVVFGDLREERFSTSLPLVTSLEQEMVFSHIASNSLYYTGLAIANPGSSPARVTIENYDAPGTRMGSVTVTIPPRQKTSRLLTEYFPQLAGQERSSGYIRVSSDRPVAAFALFGTHDGSVLSAIPPQAVR